MLLKEQREQIVYYGKKLVSDRLTRGTGGNLSIYDRDKNLIAISPSGLDYFETTPEDVVVVTLGGEIVEGKQKPSSEFLMHSEIYKTRPEFNAVVHSHAAYATAVSCLNIDLPPVNFMIAYGGGKDVKCAKYALLGTKELACNVLSAMSGRSAALLANHGLITAGQTLKKAFAVTDEIEFCSKLYIVCKSAGEPKYLSDEQMKEVLERFKTYGA